MFVLPRERRLSDHRRRAAGAAAASQEGEEEGEDPCRYVVEHLRDTFGNLLYDAVRGSEDGGADGVVSLRRMLQSHDGGGRGCSGRIPELLPVRAGHHQEAALLNPPSLLFCLRSLYHMLSILRC